MSIKEIALFLVDAGPSELMASLIKKNSQNNYHLYTKQDSPAITIFKKYGLKLKTTLVQEEDNLIVTTNFMIVASSWQTKLHFRYINYCYQNNILVFAVLDHWVNYDTRFIDNNISYIDKIDRFIVQDIFAYKKAVKYNLTPIIKIKNQYLLNLLKEKNKKLEKNQLLFLSEPTTEVALKTYKDPNYWEFNEYNALNNILENIHIFRTNTIIIRLHPSDDKNKYNYLIDKFKNINIIIELPNIQPLNNSINKSKIVIGFDTYALFVAYIFGKISISYLPTKKRVCSIPLPKNNKITTLKNLHLDNLKILKNNNEIKNFGEEFSVFLSSNLITKK